MQLKNIKALQNLLYKTDDNQFYNAIKITLCAAGAFILFYNEHNVATAFSVTLGVMLTSSSDINGSLRDKIIGLSLASVLIPTVFILLTLSYNHTAVFFAVFAILIFFSSLISLYGQRANKLSFTLLLGMCLTFIHISDTPDAFESGFYMFLGGVFYLCVSVIFYLIMPSRYINTEMSACMNLVSAYLKLRAQLWDDNAAIEELKDKRLSLQVSINTSFKNINDYLEATKMKTINSTSNRKIIMAVSFLTEIMELAISTSFNNKEVMLKLNQNPQILTLIRTLSNNFAEILEQLAISIKQHGTYTFQSNTTVQYEELEAKIKQLNQTDTDDLAYINGILFYLGKQVGKISGLERVYTDGLNTKKIIPLNTKVNDKPFTTNHYRFKTLLDNLNFKSTYFKYALRVTIAFLAGYILGNVIELKKEYWVMLTIVVIMRPGYGLTKDRAKQRVLGTVIGGIIGIFLIYFINDTVVLSVMAVIVMILSYWTTGNNYKIGVIFTTLMIVLIYKILKSGAEISVVYRIMNTLIGAFIALLATNYLWPSWESSSIKNNLIKSITSTIAYISEVKKIYFMKAAETDEFNTIRQDAYIEIGNLMASYQRLVQEPKDKQQNRSELYEIAVLNQTLVGAIASLGAFMRSHENQENAKPNESAIDTIIHNLNLSLSYFGQIELGSLQKNQNTALDTTLTGNNTEDQKAAPIALSDQDQKVKTEESKLVLDQLTWMTNLSEQIEKAAKNIT